MSAVARVRALSIHAEYACRRTGVCCSSGWRIPVEPRAEDGLRAALQAGALEGASPGETLRPVQGLPHGARVVLGGGASGRCVFLESTRLCAVHRRLGEGALPSACRHFPRVVTLTPLGVSVTLSHYCPTAASLLFRPSSRGAPAACPSSRGAPAASGDEGSADPLAILEGPPAFPSSWPWEGLDARDALPPLLRPGVLMDWPSLERWERFAVAVLGEGGRSPEEALDILEDAAEEARTWTPDKGAFGEFFAAVLSSRGRLPAVAPSSRGRFPARARGIRHRGDRRIPRRPTRPGLPGMTEAWRLAADAAPHREPVPSPLALPGDADARWIVPAWPSLARPVRRWLAAKAFASWLVLQGDGLRTAVLGLRVALGVLRAETVRGCAEAGRPLDADRLREAIRRADLLLVHLADPYALARRLSRAEAASDPA